MTENEFELMIADAYKYIEKAEKKVADAKDKHNEVMSLYVDDYEYASRLVEYAYLKYLEEESYQTVDIARQIFLMQNILRHEKRVYEDYKKALEAKKESV